MVSAEQRVPFSVFYGGVEVGTYDITESTNGSQKRLETSTNLRVTFGPLTLHRMHQTTREIWENGNLVSLEARTDENGGETRVAARVKRGDLVVDGPNGSTVARGSVGTLPSLILGDTRGQFIDPKNGLLLPIAVEKMTAHETKRHIKSRGKDIRAFSISGGVIADVWRDPEGVFLMIVQTDGVELEFRRPGTSVSTTYEPASLELRMSNVSEVRAQIELR